MATIEEVRAAHHRIMAQPGGAGTPVVAKCWRCREAWPCDTVTVLAALDEAQSDVANLSANERADQRDISELTLENARLQAQIARDAPVLAAAEAIGACIVRWPGYVPFLRADDEEFALTALVAALDARRAATTPTP